MRPRASGFTLLELLIVIMIVALLFSLLIPMYTSYQNRLTVQNSAQMIALDLAQMRQRAISLEALAGIKINSDLYTYYTFWDHSIADTDFTDGHLRQTSPGGARAFRDVNLKETFQTMVSINVTGNNNVIYFDPTTTDSGGTYWSIATPSVGSESTHSRWTADGILMTIQSGNNTSSVRLSKEGTASIATPAP